MSAVCPVTCLALPARDRGSRSDGEKSSQGTPVRGTRTYHTDSMNPNVAESSWERLHVAPRASRPRRTAALAADLFNAPDLPAPIPNANGSVQFYHQPP